MRVHYKGSSTFCCNSDAPCAEHAEKYPPAQSDAPSAEQKFSGSGAKAWWWENVKRTPFKMTPERIWRHMEAYAALRIARAEQDLRNEKEERKSFEQGWLIEKGKRETAEAKVAQIEKDVAALAQVVKDYERINATLHEEIVSQINQVGIAENQVAQLEREREQSEFDLAAARLLQTDIATESVAFQKRATAVESALSEARERAIQECIKVADAQIEHGNPSMDFADVVRYNEAVQIILKRLRALLAGASGAAGKGEDNG